MKFQLRCEFLETRDNPSGPDDGGYSVPPSDPGQVPPLPAPVTTPDPTPTGPTNPGNNPGNGF